jgi:hypothetical protein
MVMEVEKGDATGVWYWLHLKDRTVLSGINF